MSGRHGKVAWEYRSRASRAGFPAVDGGSRHASHQTRTPVRRDPFLALATEVRFCPQSPDCLEFTIISKIVHTILSDSRLSFVIRRLASLADAQEDLIAEHRAEKESHERRGHPQRCYVRLLTKAQLTTTAGASVLKTFATWPPRMASTLSRGNRDCMRLLISCLSTLAFPELVLQAIWMEDTASLRTGFHKFNLIQILALSSP